MKLPKNPIPLITLVAVNLIPFYGVLSLGWDPGWVLLLYWAESAVVGFFNILKMLHIGGLEAVGICLFFCVHFGMFMLVHLVFLGVFLSMGPDGFPSFSGPIEGFRRLGSMGWEWNLTLLSLVVSHGLSYVVNFLGRREYEGRKLNEQMGAPYGRIVVMHVAIVFGGFGMIMLGAPHTTFVLLVIFKIVLDVKMHLKEHEKGGKGPGLFGMPRLPRAPRRRRRRTDRAARED